MYIPPASHQSDRIAQSSHNWHRGAIYANDVTGYSRDVTLTLLNSWKGIRSVSPANFAELQQHLREPYSAGRKILSLELLGRYKRTLFSAMMFSFLMDLVYESSLPLFRARARFHTSI